MEGGLRPSCESGSDCAEEHAANRGSIKDRPRWFAIFLIRFYQSYMRLHLFGRCKYWPTCSEFGIECFESFGVFRGFWLTLKRVLRCHPFSKGGFDPVPNTPEQATVELPSDHVGGQP